jgi:hypothetical protein
MAETDSKSKRNASQRTPKCPGNPPARAEHTREFYPIEVPSFSGMHYNCTIRKVIYSHFSPDLKRQPSA